MVNFTQKKNPRRIFINGFKADQINFNKIHALFERFGEITAMTMMQRRVEENIIHFGFVTFKDKEGATKCLNETTDGITIDADTLVFPQLANKAIRSGPQKRYHKRRNSDRHDHHKTKRNQNQSTKYTNRIHDEEKQNNDAIDDTNQRSENPQENGTSIDDPIGSDTDFFDCY